METSDLTARQIFRQLQENPSRARFGFGQKGIHGKGIPPVSLKEKDFLLCGNPHRQEQDKQQKKGVQVPHLGHNFCD